MIHVNAEILPLLSQRIRETKIRLDNGSEMSGLDWGAIPYGRGAAMLREAARNHFSEMQSKNALDRVFLILDHRTPAGAILLDVLREFCAYEVTAVGS